MSKEQIQPNAEAFEQLRLNDGKPVVYVEFQSEPGPMKMVYWATGSPDDPVTGLQYMMYFTEGFSKDEIFEILDSVKYEAFADTGVLQ